MKRNLPSLKITLLIFCGVLAFSLPSKAQTATAPSGSGTSVDPYQIGSLENLYWIAENTDRWDDYYQQTANIDASTTSTWFSGEGWYPIGNSSTAFTGHYDGGGYIISGLFINRSGTTHLGLFGKISSGYVANLGLDGADITGSSSIGCVGGWLTTSTVIYRCWSVNSNVSADMYAGGIAGNISDSEVKQCYANVTITAPDGRSGCLVGGANSSSIIENCYALGSIDATPYAGGIVGYYSSSQMINCYSAALVDGYGGGLIGVNLSGVVDSCYWDTETSGKLTNDGGTGKTTSEMKDIMTFINGNWDFKTLGAEEIWNIGNGRNNGYPYLVWQYPADPGPSGSIAPAVVLESISDITSTTATANGNITILGIPNATQHGVCWNTSGTPTVLDTKTEDGVPSAGTYNSYITGLTANTTYYIRAYATNDDGTVYSNEVTIIATDGPGGDGSEINPYEVASLADLFWMSYRTDLWNNETWIQTADIDASETSSWNGGKGFNPVGNYNINFNGSYNGNQHKIIGLTIERPTMNYVALFGYTLSGNIEKLYLEDVLITGKNYVAGLVGFTNNVAVLDSCSVQGTITGEDYVGGYCGRNSGNITNSSANVTVNGIDKTGVFVGCNFTSNASIMNSFGVGSVTGNNQVGGFVGYNSSGYIENCYSRADVSGDIWCAGFVGYNYYGEIYKSYSTGSVSGNSSVYGFSASEANSINMDCFWDTETSGLPSSLGGTGKTTAEMKTLANYTDLATTGLSNAWDFTGTSNDDAVTEDIWAFAGNLNDGYPVLSWEFQVLSYEASANGSISGATPQYVYKGEDGTAVEAVPDEGYHFVEWSDGSTENPRTDMNVTENVAVTASFAINVYTLSYTAGDNGTLSGTLSQEVEHGSDGSEVEALPDEGYVFEDWSDGSTDNPRTDVNVTSDISVTANFTVATNVQEFFWSAIEAYPNPFGASLEVNYPREVVEVKLLNIIGQNMLTQVLNGAGKITIPTQELPPGIYLLVFRNDDGDVHTRRLLKK